MQSNPSNWQIADIEILAAHFNFTLRRPGKGGSHVTFCHGSGKMITIPAHKPIKPIYIKLFLQLIEEVTS